MPAKFDVALITNIIAPYRIPLFNALSQNLDRKLKVYFNTYTYEERSWTIPSDIKFEYEVLRGIKLTRPGQGFYESRYSHLSPNLFVKLIQQRPKVIITAEFSFPTLLAFLYSKLFGAKLISWSENTLFQEKYASIFQKRLRKFLIMQSDACIGTSSSAKEKYLFYGCPPKSVFVATQTIDVSAYIKKSNEFRKKIIQESERNKLPIIFYAGSLSQRKGVIYLLEAFSIVRREMQCKLLLAGNGPSELELREKAKQLSIKDCIEFLGFVEGDALIKLYTNADLFVFPTLEDTFGVVVNEAMACGLPIICSPFAGAAPDLVEEGVNGYIIDPRDQLSLAKNILNIISDPNLKDKMGKASRCLIEKHNIDAAVHNFKSAILYVERKI